MLDVDIPPSDHWTTVSKAIISHTLKKKKERRYAHLASSEFITISSTPSANMASDIVSTTAQTTMMDKAFAETKIVERIIHHAADAEDARVLFALERVSKHFRDTIRDSTSLQVRMGLKYPDDKDDDDADKPRHSIIAPHLAVGAAVPCIRGAEFTELCKSMCWGPFRFMKLDCGRLELHYHVHDQMGSFEKQGCGVALGFLGKSKIHANPTASWRKISLLQSDCDMMIVIHTTLTESARQYVFSIGQSKGLDGGYEEVMNVCAKQATLGWLADTLSAFIDARSLEEHECEAAWSWTVYCGSKHMVELRRAWGEMRASAKTVLRVSEEREEAKVNGCT